MSKIFVVLLFLVCACNNATDDAALPADTAPDTVQKKLYTWPAGEEEEFMAGCVDNAKSSLGDTASYRYCKCILAQVRETYPNMDSASAVLLDSAMVVSYAQNCK